MTDWLEYFIERVRAQPNLYDRSHENYYDSKGARMASFKAVSDEMLAAGYTKLGDKDTNTENVQSKWKYLRETFFKYETKCERLKLRGVTDLPGTEETRRYWSLLLWLRPHSHRIRTSENNESIMEDSIDDTLPSSPSEHQTEILISAQPDKLSVQPHKSPSMTSNIKRRKLTRPSHIEVSKPETSDDVWAKMAVKYLSAIPQSLEKERLKLALLTQILDHSETLPLISVVDSAMSPVQSS